MLLGNDAMKMLVVLNWKWITVTSDLVPRVDPKQMTFQDDPTTMKITNLTRPNARSTKEGVGWICGQLWFPGPKDCYITLAQAVLFPRNRESRHMMMMKWS